jgi:senataxin
MLLDVKDALRCVSELYDAFRASKTTRKGTLDVNISLPSIRQSLWTKVYDAMKPDDLDAMAMIIHLLSRIAHLDLLMRNAFKPIFDRVSTEVPVKQALEEVNRSLGIFRDGLSKISSRFANYNSSQDVLKLLEGEGIVKRLWSLMFSPVEDVRMAGQTIVGQAFDVDMRSDCFRSLLKHSPEQSFKGIFSILGTFISYVPTAPESCTLSASLVTCLTDVVEVLAGPLDGLLSEQSFVKDHGGFKPAKELSTFWKLMTRSTAVIFQHTPAWSVFVDDNQWMVDWMRDALIFTRQMLDCWRKFEEAALEASSAIDRSTGKVSSIGRRMVEHLQAVLPELARWLRLTDQELLHQSFALLQSLFACFEAAEVSPNPKALTKLKQDVERAQNRSSSTKLDSKRLKELHNLVVSFESGEDDDDDIQIVAPPPNLTQSKLDVRPRTEKKTVDDKASGGFKPSGRSQLSIKDFARPGQFSGAPTFSGKTLDAFFTPMEGKIASSSSKRPAQAAKPTGPKKPFWQPLPAPSREPKAALPSVKSQHFSTRDQEKLNAAVPPRPQPIQPSKVGAQASATKSDPEGASSSSSSDSDDDGGLETLRALQKEKKPERRTKILNILPGTAVGVVRAAARDQARRARERMKPDVSELHRVILSWAYEHDGDTPPGKPLSPVPVSERYSTYSQFRQTFEPLLLLECWAQLVNEKTEKKEVYDLEITSRQHSDSWVVLDTFVEEHFVTGWFLTEADIVLLRNPRTGSTVLAKVQSYKSVRAQRQGAQLALRCCLAGRPDPGLSTGSKWSISKAFRQVACLFFGCNAHQPHLQ